MQVKIYTDGAARGNPDGPGGYGAVLEYVDPKGTLHTKELSQGYKKTTNNRMELMAVIVALEALNRPCEVELYSDSKYVVDAFNQHWIDSWLKKGWKRGKNEPVKNACLLYTSYIWTVPDRLSLWKGTSCRYPQTGKRQCRNNECTPHNGLESRSGDIFR